MADKTPSGKTTVVSMGPQLDEDTYAETLYKFRLYDFDHTPNPVRGDDAAEMGEQKLDRTVPPILGFDAVDLTGNGRLRAGNQGHLLAAFGMQPWSGGIQFWAGVNDEISVTDDGGGPVTISLLDVIDPGYLTPLVAGTPYTLTEVAAALQLMLDADTTLTQTYTVSVTDDKITIAHAGTTLSLHWTTTPMMANLLGYDHSADDTGGVTYEADDERSDGDVTAKHWFRTGINDGIVITDNGGGPFTVSVIGGTGSICTARYPLSPFSVGAALKAVLDNQGTLDGVYTVTYDTSTNLYTIETDSVSLDIDWTDAACTISDDLGFTADDTGATTYTADDAKVKANKHLFVPIDVGADFPHYTFRNQVDPAAWLDLIYKASRLSSLTIEGADKAELTINFSGQAVTWKQVEAETLNVTAEQTGVVAPNTLDAYGHTELDGTAFRIAASSIEMTWDVQVEPQQCEGEPYNIEPNERSCNVTIDVYLGAREGEIYREIFFGAIDGNSPSTTPVEKTLDLFYASGTVVPGQTGSTERFAFRLEADEANLMNRTTPQAAGDLVHGDLTCELERDSTGWMIGLVNNMDFKAYEYVA